MTADDTQRRDATVLRGAGIALGAAAALGAVATMAAPLVSGDLFWHLSAGRWMLANGALPETDPFSHTAGDARWVLQEYGSQVLFAAAERVGGLDGLRVVGALLAAALALVVWRTARRPPSGTVRMPLPLAGALLALFVALYAYKWELRPQLLSAFLLFALVRLLFERRDDEPAAPTLRQSLLAGALCCLWVQLHAEALFGPILATVGASGALAAAVFVRGAAFGARLRRIGRWSVAFISVFVGTLLSPLGLEPHRYALSDRSVAQQYIEEWQHMFADGARAFPLTLEFRFFVWITAFAVLAILLHQATHLIGGRERARGGPHWERFAFGCLCLLMAVMARRYFWLLWFPLLDGARQWVASGAPTIPSARRTLVHSGALTAAVLALAASANSLIVEGARRALVQGRYDETVDSAYFPVHATQVVDEAGLNGNLFHPYSWGGYLGWILGPDNPVFVDGRTVLFQDVIPIRHRAEREPDYARQILDDFDVDVIVYSRLVDHGAGPFAWRPPDAERRWIRAWVDRAAVVWLRREREDLLEALADWYAVRNVPFDRERGANAYAPLVAQPDWLDERELLSPDLTDAVRGRLKDVGADGATGARAWIALAEGAAQRGLEREAAFAFVRAGEALYGPLEPAAESAWRERFRDVGAQRALADLRREAGRDARASGRDEAGGRTP